MQTMEIKLKALTPLWTGGVDQEADRLHETGLIGSLRWWYEALVRGLGGYACDPTSDSRCEYNPKDPRPPEKQLCAACYLLGCTGWGRKFRLVSFGEGRPLFQGQNVLLPSERVHKSRRGPRAGGWFLFGESRMGEISVKILPLRDITNEEMARLSIVMEIINRYAAFAAKVSSGYGVVSLQAGFLPQIFAQLESTPSPRDNEVPDLRDFFFARYEFVEPEDENWWKHIFGVRQAVAGKLDNGSSPGPLRQAVNELEQAFQEGVLPIAPAIRNWLRYSWQPELPPCQEYYVFAEAQSVCPACCRSGFRQDKRNADQFWCPNCKTSFKRGNERPAIASKISISYAYRCPGARWEFRIWGWLPCNGEVNDRDKFLSDLKDALRGEASDSSGKTLWQFVFGKSDIQPREVEWHVLDCNKKDLIPYLKTLVGGSGGAQ